MASRRRGQGEGSVFQLPDGRWVAEISLPSRLGKRRRKKFYDTTAAKVRAKVLAYRASQQDGVVVDDALTVKRLLTDWLASVKSTVRIRSYEKYESIVNKHLLPDLGRIRLEKLSPQHVQTLIDAKLAAGLHPNTVSGIKIVLSHALSQAMRFSMIGRNVAALVRGPKIPRHEMSVRTQEQAAHFIECCDKEPLGAFYVLKLHTGLRRGEGTALRWQDVDLVAGIATIKRSLQRSNTQGLIFEEPKSVKSRRSISLAPAVIAALKAHRARQNETRLAAGPEWQDNDLIFCTGIGTPIDPRSLSLDYDRMIEKSELPRIRLHDMRHTFATIGLGHGVHPKVMSDMLGHSKVSLTLDVYSHALPSFQTEASDKIAHALAAK
jgi:integrase